LATRIRESKGIGFVESGPRMVSGAGSKDISSESSIDIPMEASISDRGDKGADGTSGAGTEVEGEPRRDRGLCPTVSPAIWFEPNSLDIASSGGESSLFEGILGFRGTESPETYRIRLQKRSTPFA